jgi:2-iminobutanoate/2-iminopropanoate deaminase
MKRKRLAYVAVAVTAGSVIAAAQTKQVIAPPGLQISGIPYSPGVRTADLYHVAGTMGTDTAGKIVAGGIEAQTKKALENIGTILKAGGMDYKDVVSTNVYLADMRDFDAMNKVYREVFRTNPPVRATTQADLMLRDGLVEISAIAARAGLERRYINPQGWSTNPLPYSRGIAVGDHIFLAGLTSQNPQTGAALSGDIKVQTKQILENAKVLAETAGFKMSDMVFSRVWLTDPRDFQDMNDIYRTYFGDIPPTRATTRAALASPAYKAEIMLWGVKGQKQRLGDANPNLSQAIKVGNYVFLAGLTAGAQTLRGDVGGQTNSILTNVQNLLKAGAVESTNVVTGQVWLSDARNFSAMNEAYVRLFKTDPPARATVGSQLMSADNLVEIAVIAVK